MLTLGQGRSAAGRIGDDVGFNAYALRSSNSPGYASSAQVRKTGETHALATTEIHHLIDVSNMFEDGSLKHQGTDWTARSALDKRTGKKPGDEGILIKQTSFDEYSRFLKSAISDPYAKSFANDDAHGDITLQLYDAPLAEQFAQRAADLKEQYPDEVAEGWEPVTQFNDKHAWGMTIDMTTCIGCSSCVVACQSENNIPIVGKDQVDDVPRDAVAADRQLFPRRSLGHDQRQDRRRAHAGDLYPLRKRPLRAGLPRRRDGSRHRRPQHDGLQPLHRHAVLLQQLPL